MPSSSSGSGNPAAASGPAGREDETAAPRGRRVRGGVGRAADGDACRTLGSEPGSRKRKSAVIPAESDDSMGSEEDMDLCEESRRISMEMENLRSRLAEKKKEFRYCQENKKLRVELALKEKDVECLRKQNEELKAKNKGLENNLERWKKTLEPSNARFEENRKLHEGNNEGVAESGRQHEQLDPMIDVMQRNNPSTTLSEDETEPQLGAVSRPRPGVARPSGHLQLIDPEIDIKHRSRLASGDLHPTLRLRTPDRCWSLDPRWIPRLRAAGLLPLSRLIAPTRQRANRFPVDRSLVTALVDRWRPETHTFHLPFGEMAPTLQDVSMLLGLPIAGDAVCPLEVGVSWKDEILERFKDVLPEDAQPPQFDFTSKHGPSRAWIEQFGTERLTVDTDDRRVRRHLEAYLLWLFGWVMFTSTHGDSVDKHLIRYAQQVADNPLEEIPQYSWGSAVLAATYRALCDSCIRTGPGGSFTGCPLLIMLWSFERFNIGRPRLSSWSAYGAEMYTSDEFGVPDLVDRPTMGSIWTSRNPKWTNATHRVYPWFVASFDQLRPDQVCWTPYTPHDIAKRAPLGLSSMCTRNEGFWLTRRCLVFDVLVEPYSPHRVFRQFGLYQQFPLPIGERLDEGTHRMKRQGMGLAYEASFSSKMQPWRAQWQTADTEVHEPTGPYDPCTYEAYLRWYHAATRWRLFPVPQTPVYHEANNTDMFATQPPAAYQTLMNIMNEVGMDLVDLARRVEAVPAPIDEHELASTLRHLAQRLLEGVRHATCQSTSGVPEPLQRRSPPSTMPSTTSGQTEPRRSQRKKA